MLDYWKNLSNKEKFFFVSKFFIGLLFLIFIVRNWQSTEVNVVFFTINIPLTLLMGLSAALGALLASIWYLKKINAKNSEIKRLTNKHEESENNKLKNESNEL